MASLTRFETVEGLQGVETVFGCDWIWWLAGCSSPMGAETLPEFSERVRPLDVALIPC